MKNVYPVILTPDSGMYIASVPDFDIMTQGDDLADAIEMSRDAICLMAVDMMSEKKDIPKPSNISQVKADDDSVVTLVDVDFESYRKKLENRAVKKNCTIPSWLNDLAIENNVNFSLILREALEERLNVR